MRIGSRVFTTMLLIAFCSALALAQGGNPPASTKEAGQTSGHGMTGVEQTPPGAEAQIRALDEQARQSALKGDASFLEKYLAPNYIAIGDQGQEVTRDQAIQMRKSGAVKYDKIDLHDTKIRFFGNTAIVNHSGNVQGTYNGKPFGGDSRAVFVWVKQGGQWKVASFSVVPIQGSAPTAK